MLISSTRLTLLLSAIIPFLLYLTTGHLGDLVGYTTFEFSSRLFYSTALIQFFWFLTKSYAIVIILWSLLMFCMASLLIKYLDTHAKITVISLSPFLFFPSKESTLFLYFIILIVIFRRLKLIKYLLTILAATFVRPMIVPLCLYLNITRKQFLAVIIVIFFLTPVFLLRFDFQSILNETILLGAGFSFDYFSGASVAGTSTDLEFLGKIKTMTPLEFLYTGMFRFFFPFWMLDLNLTSKIYFFIYSNVLIFSAVNLRKFVKQIKKPYSLFFYFIIVGFLLVGFMPLCITNAGSAVRYISIAIVPFILSVASQNVRN